MCYLLDQLALAEAFAQKLFLDDTSIGSVRVRNFFLQQTEVLYSSQDDISFGRSIKVTNWSGNSEFRWSAV